MQWPPHALDQKQPGITRRPVALRPGPGMMFDAGAGGAGLGVSLHTAGGRHHRLPNRGTADINIVIDGRCPLCRCWKLMVRKIIVVILTIAHQQAAVILNYGFLLLQFVPEYTVKNFNSAQIIHSSVKLC